MSDGMRRAIDSYIRKVVDQAPPLSQEQRDKIRALLRPVPEEHFEVSKPMSVRIER